MPVTLVAAVHSPPELLPLPLPLPLPELLRDEVPLLEPEPEAGRKFVALGAFNGLAKSAMPVAWSLLLGTAMPHGHPVRHRWILLLVTFSLAHASTACFAPYRDIGAPGPADVTGTGSIGAPRLPGVAAWIAPYHASSSSSSSPSGGSADGASIYGALLMLGLGIPVTVLGIEGLASKSNLGDAIYVTTGGAVLDAGGVALLLQF